MAAVQPQPQSAAPESGDLYRLIADTIPHMVWAARADGWVDFFNQRFQAYSGLDKSQLEGWGWEAVVHPEDLHRCLELWNRVLDTAERYEIECRIRRADGAYRWHQVTAVASVGARGDVQRWFGTCTDIEAGVRSAESLERMVEERTEALRESETRFRSLTLLTADSYWEQDEQYRFTSFITSGAIRPHGLGERVRVGTRRWDNGYVNMCSMPPAPSRAIAASAGTSGRASATKRY
jgi:PAS domain S-box-containing protein